MHTWLGLTLLVVTGLAAGCGGDTAAKRTARAQIDGYSAAALHARTSPYARLAGDQQPRHNDVALLIKVKTALVDSPGLKPFALEVGVLNGVVTLYGEVDTIERRAMAERIARDVRGVASVKSGIAVTARA
jgi:osmotically-inducible protein OsmY